MFAGHENCIFGKPAEKKTLNCERFSTQIAKLIKTVTVYFEKSKSLENLSRDARNAVLTAMLEIFDNIKVFLARISRKKEYCKSWKKNLSSRSSSGLAQKQFWWPLPSFSAKIAKFRSFVSQDPKSLKKQKQVFHWYKISWKVLFGHVKRSFDKLSTRDKSSGKCPKWLIQNRNCEKKNMNFWKKKLHLRKKSFSGLVIWTFAILQKL